MKRNHHYLPVFIFLLLIPYLCSLIIIGLGYNALVNHATSPWRSLIGALVGAMLMMAIKATIQRPLDLIAINIHDGIFKQIIRFFSIRRRPVYQAANFALDFGLCLLATWLIRKVLPLNTIVNTATGWVLLIMFISTCLGAFVEYDNLSIDRQ
ncbi:MAG: hypothetical protein LKF01_00905 [Lactobacillus sp.]|jgi:hypothetical protein|nr:hypothetical protein [Lactobacillus sp.]MCH3989734.1 hypothetical protein [Lactobacillus sp.]MCH4068100.1 hypothetical protein [Lactobacillus sp.]MCI1304281.1 hypothetical protein [Lactobacillus sp.]MCI1330030.1 hypothetical protein [Lactobacillus sp.]